ncbi:MAG: hypothetical protein M5R36_17320 [Deltaproteobacteria bacterium]|nr:hypothetical protein [Deltaproteobacteria bacterium]
MFVRIGRSAGRLVAGHGRRPSPVDDDTGDDDSSGDDDDAVDDDADDDVDDDADDDSDYVTYLPTNCGARATPDVPAAVPTYERGTAVGVDADDSTAFVFFASISRKLTLYEIDGGNVASSTIATTTGRPAAAYDSEERMHVAYADYETHELVHLARIDGVWERSVADCGDELVAYDIAVDAWDRVHLVYGAVSVHKTRHAVRFGNGEWRAGIVRPGYFDRVSIDVDDGGVVHAAGAEWGSIFAARRAHGKWTIWPIRLSYNLIFFSALSYTPETVVSNGIDAHAAFIEEASYFFPTPKPFSDESTDFLYIDNPLRPDEASYPLGRDVLQTGLSLATDKDGGVHAAMASVDRLWYAERDGETGIWDPATADIGGGSYSDIFVAADGRVHISHTDKTGTSVYYSTYLDGTWETRLLNVP